MSDIHAHNKSLTKVTSVDAAVAKWASMPKGIVRDFIKRYGMPHEATTGMVLWHYNTPWRRTVVYHEPVNHNFPRRHADHVKQTIAYRVPMEKVGPLLLFNGSIIIDRTRGEISSRCHSEGMNYLLLNLAHEIVNDKKTVEEARSKCVKVARMLNLGWPDRYSQGLQFAGEGQTVESESTVADPDRAARVLF